MPQINPRAELDAAAAALERCCPGAVRRNEPLARHVSFWIGGPADILVLPRTLESLDAAMPLRDPGLINLKTDPLMDPLRNEPRFQAIERALRFPD